MCSSDQKNHPIYSNEKVVVNLVNRVVACENARWIVYLDHISDSVDFDVPNYMVLHPKVTHDYLVTGVCVLPVYEGKLGLVSYYRHPIEELLWEVPRGFIDLGEKPEQAAIRELREETGLVCDPDNLVALGCYLPEPSTIRARGALFAAESCKPGTRHEHREPGLGELSFFPVDKVFEMISSSEIQDASSLITCYRYRDRLKTDR